MKNYRLLILNDPFQILLEKYGKIAETSTRHPLRVSLQRKNGVKFMYSGFSDFYKCFRSNTVSCLHGGKI